MNIFDPVVTGSLVVSGSAQITGNLSVTGSIVGTIAGGATTGANTFQGNQIINGNLTITGATTGSSFTGSFTGSLLGTSSTASFVTLAQTASFVATAQTASFVAGGNVSGNITGNATNITAYTVNQNVGTSNSPTFAGLTVQGNLIAQQYIVSSSVTYLTESFASGSHKFGDTIDDTHQFTGSVYISGSATATAFYEVSDLTLKNVLERNPMVDLSSLDVIKFKFIDKEQIRYGYPAQEVQALCSDLVVGTNPLTVNYTDVHTLKILQLEEKINELEIKLELLYGHLDRDNK